MNQKDNGKAEINIEGGINLAGKVLAKNTLFNLMGRGVPLLAAFFTIPILIDYLGKDRFGVLALAWMVVGYFGIFDMGISRATTKFLAETLARKEYELVPSIFYSSMFMLAGLGVFGFVTAFLVTPWLVQHVFNIPSALAEETTGAFYLLAFSIPWVICTAGAQGVLEAQQKFGLLNAVKIPASIFTFVGPLLIVPYSVNLFYVTAVLIVGRILAFILYIAFAHGSISRYKYPRKPSMDLARSLLSFGGWLTVSNIVGPIMVYMDRFIVGALLTMSAVTFYVTPFELVSKVLIVPFALLGVLFPAFSAYSRTDIDKLDELYQKSIKYLIIIVAPVVVVTIIFAEPFMDFWLGTEFAQNSAIILQLLSLGVLINTLAYSPINAIQALGRPDVSAKIHLFELPIYLLILWFLVKWLGINGVAIAWVVRVILDNYLLNFNYHRLNPKTTSKFITDKPLFDILIVISIAVAFGISLIPGIVYKTVLCLILLTLLILHFWKRTLQAEDKQILYSLIKNR
ncbi:MAG: oligosaccharide flippase family protein [candidate division Zixibacteria bacterium]|nr:oligosaccharide flippase family protein [candidate division Zixibacteria bacterium]